MLHAFADVHRCDVRKLGVLVANEAIVIDPAPAIRSWLKCNADLIVWPQIHGEPTVWIWEVQCTSAPLPFRYQGWRHKQVVPDHILTSGEALVLCTLVKCFETKNR